MQKIAIVGNGKTYRKIGSIINKCDRVIRFNGFRIKNYESFVGSKIDIVMLIPTGNGCNQVYKELKYNIIDKTNEFWFSRPRSQCKRPYKELLKKINHKIEHKILHPDTDLWKSTLKKLSFNNPKKLWPSSGFVAIEMVNNLFENCEIYLTGFDAFKTNHYYSRDYIWGTAHPVNAEFAIIRNYIKLGKIIKLS